MEMTDYGKLAYVKLGELEKRLREMETAEKEYNSLRFSALGEESALSHTVVFRFTSTVKQTLSADITMATGATATLNVYLNDVLIKNRTVSGSVAFALDCPLDKGENALKFTLSAASAFVLTSLAVGIVGTVDYVNGNEYLCGVTYADYTAAGVIKDGVFKLYKYAQTTFNCVFELEDTLSAKVMKFGSKLALLAISTTGVCRCFTFLQPSFALDGFSLVSVCASGCAPVMLGDTMFVMCCEGGKGKLKTLDGAEFIYTLKNSVDCSAMAFGGKLCFIVSDRNGKNKYVETKKLANVCADTFNFTCGVSYAQ